MGKITEEKNNVGDNNEERDTFNEDIKETSSRVRLRKPKKKVSVLNYIICIRGQYRGHKIRVRRVMWHH